VIGLPVCKIEQSMHHTNVITGQVAFPEDTYYDYDVAQIEIGC